MTRNNPARAGALLAFVLAESVTAHPLPVRSIDQVRLIGAIDIIPDASAYDRGKALLAADDVIGALAAFRQALSAAPMSVDAMNGLGVSYDRLGRADLARSFYVAGLAIDPISPSLNNNFGYSLYLSGDYSAAIAPLRVAAASTDAAAAAAAQATLARLVAEARVTPADIATSAAAAPRIELTSDDEQRLSFQPAEADTSTLGDGAATTVVAAAWTPADDAALIARVAAQQAIDEAADRAALAPPTAPASPAPVELAAAEPPPRPSFSARSIPTAPSARAVAGLVLAPATAATTPRRTRTGAAMLATAISGGPQPRVPAGFDSDDVELNAFAARMAVRDAAELSLPGDRGRIAARFRA